MKKSAKPSTVVSPTPLEDLLQARLGRIHEVINQLARYSVGARGLRTTDLRIMNLLFDAGTLSINELARRAHVDKAWISRSVMQLLQKRWVSKQPDPADARAQLIRLTPKSRALLESVRPQMQANEVRLLTGVNAAQLKKQLDKVFMNAELLLESYERTRKARK